MIKLFYECNECGASDEADDYELDGCCPNCHEHHGSMEYYYEDGIEKFLTELADMSESEFIKNYNRITLAANSLLFNL